MAPIKQRYTIAAPVSKVWDALINPKQINAWGGGPAKMEGKVGTKFTLWGGSIWGKNIEVIPEKKLVQEWYSDDGGKWEKPSIATFTLQSENNTTIVELIHKDVPADVVADIDDGWKAYYLGPLKEYVEKTH